MNSMERSLKYKFKSTGKSMLVFWIVVLIIDGLSIFFNFKYGNENTFYFGFSNLLGGEKRYSIFGANIMPILIYLIITPYTNYYEDFSRMINFSITRKTIFKTNLISNITIAFIFALIQSILMKFDPFVMESIGKKPLYEFFLFNTQGDSLIFILGILFITLVTFISLWQLIASLNYKYGMKIWGVFLALILIVNNIIINSLSLFDLIFPGEWLNKRLDMSRLLLYIGFIIISQGFVFQLNKITDK